MSPLLKYTLAGSVGGIAGNYLATYATGMLPASVPAPVTQIVCNVATIYIALRLAGAGK